MKASFSLLFLALSSLFVLSVSLIGEQVHLGTENPYPIGNKDVPSKVFLFFLQQKLIQGYEDDAFMTSPNNWLGNSKASIEYIGKAPNFVYFLILNQKEDIIDGVNDSNIRDQFNDWYSNWTNSPTRQEVADYFRCKSLAYFWSHSGQTIQNPTVYFDDQGHNVTSQHQFLVSNASSNPNHDFPVTGADAISKRYEDACKKMIAQYPNAPLWQPARHDCPIFMNGRVRLFEVQQIPSGTIFDFINLLYEEKMSSIIHITRGDVTQEQDGFDFTSFNSVAPIPAEFAVTVCYDNALIGRLANSTSKTLLNETLESNTIPSSGTSSHQPSSSEPSAGGDSSSKKDPNYEFAHCTRHDEFTSFFTVNILQSKFIDSPILKFSSSKESFSQSIYMMTPPVSVNSIATLTDPTTGWMRDTYDWDLFGVMYDALDLGIK